MERYRIRCWRPNLFGKGSVCTWTDVIFAEDADEAYNKFCFPLPPLGPYKIEICLLTYEPDGSSSWSIVDVRYPEEGGMRNDD